jgi:dipeptidyl aminopeptidase/acylaminoacyl peptidase
VIAKSARDRRRSLVTPMPAAALLAAVLGTAAWSAAPPPPAPAPAAAPAAAAAPAIGEMLTLAAALDSFKSVALAPDGGKIAWVEGLRAADGRPSRHTAVFASDLAGSGGATRAGGAGGPAPPPRRIGARGESCAKEPAWSPDGRRLAFLSDGSAGAAARRSFSPGGSGKPAAGAAEAPPGGCAQLQLWVADLASGQVAELTHLEGQISAPAWSPDGGALAFLHIAGRTAEAGPTHAVPRDRGVVGETPEEQRLAVVELATGRLREVSPPDLFVHEYDWSPDGAAFAAVAATGSGDDNWWIARLYRFDRASGAATPLLQPSFQIADPRWSPDGRQIAFIGGLMSDQGVTGGDVYAIAAAGGAALDLTPGLAASAASLSWTASGELLAFEIVDGTSGLAMIDPAGGNRHATEIWRRPADFGGSGGEPGLSVARDGKTAAAIVSSFGQPPEIWVGPVIGPGPRTGATSAAATGAAAAGTTATGTTATGTTATGATAAGAAATSPLAELGWRQITQRNAGLRPSWGEARSLHWPSDTSPAAPAGSGTQLVQGWLLAPMAENGRHPAPPPSGRYPMVVLVHGGPAAAARPGWPRVAGVLASQGFYVLLPNPRGSYGQGEEFTRGNVKDFGYGDLRDILGGIDAATAAAPIDPERIGVFGWSYGGYMTMWAVTQTQRFRAAVAGAGIVNWQSYYGQNGIDQWMIPYFGASVYDDPWIYARSSPISFIKAVRTPTLVLQGERDAEVPAPQAYEFWHALKTLGVETRLVIYPDEGHHLSPANNLDVMQRTVDWFRTHLR